MIEVIDDFLTEKECKAVYEEGPHLFKWYDIEQGYRQCKRWILDNTVEREKVRSKMEEMFGRGYICEPPQVIHYGKGQLYKPHQDDRYATMLVYLTDDFKGGHTSFPNRQMYIEPKLGRAVVWTNYLEDGITSDSLNKHGSSPVVDGLKITLVQFMGDGHVKR